jgi:flagellin
MSLVINTNSAATTAANNLAASNQFLQRSLNRLSSGSKIVSPADDAGGLAVSMKLSAAAKRQGAALNNISNSVSYLQTQDGALKVAGKVLDRIGELKTLATDRTKSASDIANYNTEFTALQAQLTSLAGDSFNGVALFGSATLDVATTESGGGVISTGGIDLLGGATGFTENFNNLSQWTNQSTGAATAVAAGGTLTLTDNGNEALVTTTQTFSGPTTIEYNQTGSIEIGLGGNDIVNIVGPGAIQLVFDGAGNVDLSIDGSFITSYIVPTSGALSFGTGSGNGSGTISSLTVVGGGGGGGSSDISNVASAASLTALSLSTVTSAIQDLATHRATNGAQQSRLGFAAELLTVNKSNLEAANSRIVDVDVAAESTQLARYNILVQAGASMLAQANQSTQNALKLLG